MGCWTTCGAYATVATDLRSARREAPGLIFYPWLLDMLVRLLSVPLDFLDLLGPCCRQPDMDTSNVTCTGMGSTAASASLPTASHSCPPCATGSRAPSQGQAFPSQATSQRVHTIHVKLIIPSCKPSTRQRALALFQDAGRAARSFQASICPDFQCRPGRLRPLDQ